ncbi:alpha/beta hydrolase [Nocardioides mangrovicus]|uniref:Alpha/beta hydrolase n=1 Tax=Nocardioides mangrovicus TaxID=2478913 RepID=A0A3L8NZR7_9ACTN|nr:alpha/beta hydrolase [Nocardioides mangrovicus]RLV48680.1 alpha/beta hydrolase [Nocardioides mangrovicus]
MSVALVATGAVAAGSTASAAPSRPAVGPTTPIDVPTPPPISFGPCGDDQPGLQRVGAQCGLLTVPLDYANPTGAKIQLAVSRLAHTVPDAQSQGIMLVNPGGPGGSGLGLSVLGGKDSTGTAYIPGGAGGYYDWIGFDPRGVGDSVPSLSCNTHYFGFDRPDYRTFTQKLRHFWLAKALRYSKACQKKGGALLDHVRTLDNVYDMESIRKALGQNQINYYGFSYGTYLGQVYATVYPSHVRRMVWDGVVSPTDTFYKSNQAQDKAFEKTINTFFGWVARHHKVYQLGTTKKQVKHRWYALLAKSKRHPFAGKIGPDEWTDLFQGAGYYVYGWAETATLFRATARGNYKPAVREYPSVNGTGPGSDNGFAMYLATECTDGPWPSSQKKIDRDNKRLYNKGFHYLTYSNAQFNGPCRTWKGKADPAPVKIADNGVAPILMVEETFDPATPFKGALQARRIFSNSVMIEGKNGTTHAGSLSGVACTDDTIATYLINGTLPARQAGNRSDKTCPPVPRPAAERSSGRSTSDRSASSTGWSEVRQILAAAQQHG